MNVRIGITGTRHGVTDAQKITVTELVNKLQSLVTDDFVLNHGACVGADEWFVLAFHARFMVIRAHPSNLGQSWSALAMFHSDIKEPELPPLVRNHNIVDRADTLIAMPGGDEVTRSGTWATIRYARKQKDKQIYIVYPDGSKNYERT